MIKKNVIDDKWPPADMDPECVELCTAINRLQGVGTYDSCCGHGKAPYMVWVSFDGMDDILPLLYYLDECHSGVKGWICTVYTDCVMSRVVFNVVGPMGEKGYKDSAVIAQMLNDYVGREDDLSVEGA